MPTGPNTVPQDPDNLLTTQSVGFTIGASDHPATTDFNCGFYRRVIANAAGNIAIKRKGDTAFVVYAAVQGQAIDGLIQTVGGTGSGSSAIAVVCET